MPSARCEVMVNGEAVVYKHTKGTGTPVILIHGIGSSSHTWARTIERLEAAGRSTIAVDLPGHGLSRINPGHHGIDDFVESVITIMDAESIDRAHLVGHSLGGGVALQLTETHPKRYASLTLSAPGGLGATTSPLLKAGGLPGSTIALKLAVNNGTVNFAQGLSRALGRVGLTPYQLSDGVLEVFNHLAQEDHRDAFVETLRGVVGPSGQTRSALGKLDKLDGRRITIVWCEYDPVLPSNHGRRAAAALKGSTLVILPGTSHEPHTHDVETFTGLLLDQVRRWESVKARRRKIPEAG